MVLLFRKRKIDLGNLPAVGSNPETDLPSLSVIIPVRNELSVIDRCLASYLRQTYPPDRLEIVVVDDESSDGTKARAAAIAAREPGLRLVAIEGLPPGWGGKSHACWIGAGEASGGWLCFVDADTSGEPELLVSAIEHAEKQGLDLLSLMPDQTMAGFSERLLMPLPMMGLLLAMDTNAIRDPGSSTALAIGQFMLVKRDVYFAVGGHRAIRGEILEDVALAKLIKSNGFSIDVVGGRDLIQTRMYAAFEDLWSGLGRSTMDLFGAPFTSLAVFGSVLGSLLPLLLPALLIGMAVEARTDPVVWLGAGLALLGSSGWLLAHALVFRLYRVPAKYLFLLPVSYWGLAGAILDGLIRKALGLRSWKGRPI
jgi:chlorobactene glucosyltransferase